MGIYIVEEAIGVASVRSLLLGKLLDCQVLQQEYQRDDWNDS